MAIEKYIGKIKSPGKRGFSKPSYRDLHKGKVTVDDEGRVFVFGNEEVGPLDLETRFHFFQTETGDDWPRVRAFYKLPKTMRRSCKSHGVRQGEGKLVGLWPKQPIHFIQEQREKEAGETSWRMPAYGKQLERMILRDLAAAGPIEPSTPAKIDAFLNPKEKDPFAPDDEELPF